MIKYLISYTHANNDLANHQFGLGRIFKEFKNDPPTPEDIKKLETELEIDCDCDQICVIGFFKLNEHS